MVVVGGYGVQSVYIFFFFILHLQQTAKAWKQHPNSQQILTCLLTLKVEGSVEMLREAFFFHPVRCVCLF